LFIIFLEKKNEFFIIKILKKMKSIFFYPLVYKYKDLRVDHVVTDFSEKEWKKLIKETKEHLDTDYNKERGLRIHAVRRNMIHLEIMFDIGGDKIKPFDIREILTNGILINGEPSFFKDNYENDKSLNNFVFFELEY
jgi:hypothetical protein